MTESKKRVLIVDDDPAQGIVEGQDFLHPDLRLAFSVPAGFGIQNGTRAVAVIGNSGQAQFSTGPFSGNLDTYVGQVFQALAGQQAKVTLQVRKVSEPVLPEPDAAFIRSFGIRSGEMDEFRREIRSNLERELKGALMNRLRRSVGEQIIATYGDVEMPTRMVEAEARAMAEQAAEQARRQGRKVGELPADAWKGFQEAARKRVLVGLLVGEVARRNELKLDPSRVEETLGLIASTYEEPEQVVELYRNDARLMSGLRNRVMEEQVTDWIAERATHTDETLSFQEAIR